MKVRATARDRRPFPALRDADRIRGGRQPLRRPRSPAAALPQSADRQAERNLRDELRRQAAAAGDERRQEPRQGPDGAARPPRRLAHDAGQPADPPQGRRSPRPARPRPTLHFTDVGAYFGGSYWKVHQLARFELRRVGPDGKLGPVLRTSPKLNYCLRDLERTRPGKRSPGVRHYPGCDQDPYTDAVTLGTSVGWSDIYPADYDKQWIDVSGLRGCFAFTMTVDPKHLLFESNEHDNTSRRLVRLPYRGQPGC